MIIELNASPIITWLLIANTEKAVTYQIVRKKYSLVKILTHAESRLKTSDLVTDKPGHYKTSTTRGQFIPPTDLHENEHKVFARELAHYLKESQQKNCYQKLILCAEPHFYGLINQYMTKPIRSSIVTVIEKDLIPLPRPELNAVIQTIIKDML